MITHDDGSGIPFQKRVNTLLRSEFGQEVTFAQLDEFKMRHGYMPFYIRKDPNYRKARGVYTVPADDAPLSKFGPGGEGETTVLHKENPTASMLHVNEDDESEQELPNVNTPKLAFKHDEQLTASAIEARLRKLALEASMLCKIPEKLVEFVPFGDFDMIRNIVKSLDFFPVFTTGHTGNGKTLFVEQACAQTGREYVRINITEETDEDDLIGGFRLRNGETYFELGPIPVAMIRGTVVNIDEIDLGRSKLMCLQPVLEGKPLTIKKLGVTIKPAKGFTIFATANTKGRGDESGRYIGTGLLNEAFLDRFPITIEQEYPNVETETKILNETFKAFGGTPSSQSAQFFDTLAKWSENIRAARKEDAIEDLITTRRLCHVVRAYKVFGSNQAAQDIALDKCTNRFDTTTKDAFLQLWNKLVPDPTAKSNVGKVKNPW